MSSAYTLLKRKKERERNRDTVHPNMDLYEYLQIFPNPDGSFTRKPTQVPSLPPTPTHPAPVLSKDITINPLTNTWARIFLPTQPLTNNTKLPLIIYFHGGGFLLFSPASAGFHVYCSNLAVDLPAVVVSVGYRLAPEHRLPAAYEDAMDALKWMKDSDDVWLKEHVDFDACFLMGASAGATIAYNAGLRVAESVNDFEPLKFKGLILQQPFFGGSQKSESELRLVNDPILPPGVTDLMWEMSLPKGVDRDHEYCNPTVGGGSRLLDEIKRFGWRVFVSGNYGDPLIDRQLEVVKWLEGKGIKVETVFAEGGHHGIEIMDQSKAKAGFVALKHFIGIL